MKISEIGINLVEKNGFYAVNDRSVVSFPEEGNHACFQFEDNSFWFKHRNLCILKAIKNYQHEGVFLDIGGGNGYVTKMLHENGFDAVLVEPGLEGCMNARTRGLEKIINAALEDIQFSQSAKVSAIGAFDVVEHIQEDYSFLRTCHQVLDENGKLFITVPAFQSLWSEDDVFAGHFRRYTIDSLRTVVQNAGFNIKYITYFFQPLILPIFLFRTIPSKFRSKTISLEKSIREHGSEGGIIVNMMSYLLKRELHLISTGKHIPFGSSILMVAEK